MNGDLDARDAIFIAHIDHLQDAVASLPQSDASGALRYALPRRRGEFLAGRALLRLALASRLGLSFGDIRFDLIDDAPRVAGRPDVALSLSHSRGIVGCALTRQYACGFDLQRKLEKPLLDIAEAFFPPDEYDALAALDGPARVDYFYECWTVKEAWAKASGHALLAALGRASLAQNRDCADEDWMAWRLAPTRDTAAALVVSMENADAPGQPTVSVWRGDAFERAAIECDPVGLSIRYA
jgi:4'-phosphopantetheinyl transferase